MTAVNVVLQPDRAILMTDAAFYDTAGNVVGFGTKAFPIPNLKAAIAVRGPQGVVAPLGMDMSSGYPSFDVMTDRLEADLFDWHGKIVPHLEAIGWSTVELHIVGWSERERRPRHFAWTNHPDSEEDAFELVETDDEVGNYCFAPNITDEEAFERLPSMGVRIGGANFVRGFDPNRDGLALMEAQRRSREVVAGLAKEDALSIVGGFMAVTEITASGITMTVPHRWSDLAGEPIEPAPWVSDRAVPVPMAGKVMGDSFAQFPAKQTPPAGLNRQQRRAWERKHGAAA